MTLGQHTVIAHLFLLLTQIVGFGFQWLREGRQHRWQKEQFRVLNVTVANGHAPEKHHAHD